MKFALERKLCEDFHILPQQYLLAKEAMIREYSIAPDLMLTRDKARTLTDLDPLKLEKIHNFLYAVGWINSRGHKSDAPVQTQRPPGSTHQAPLPAAPAPYPQAGKKRHR